MAKREIGRRGVLCTGLLAGVGLLVRPQAASATVETATAMMNDLIGGKTPQEGRVKVDMPQIAENGNTVPLTVTVDSPMTDADHVKAVHILADGNPDSGVASFRLTPLSGKAEVSVRMRLARTQNVWAVAEMSDGSVFMGKTEVKVTIGGCGG